MTDTKTLFDLWRLNAPKPVELLGICCPRSMQPTLPMFLSTHSAERP
jgi:hypothetical protein